LLFCFPDTLQILKRGFYYNYPAQEDLIYVTEELTFQNNSNKEINEIILQIEVDRYNLRIVDKNNINLVYLPEYEIIRMGEAYIGPDMINDLKDNKIHLLWIILNKPLLPHQQQIISMKYIEQSAIQRKWAELRIFEKETIKNKITFYDNETITISASWEEGLRVEGFPIFAVTKKETLLWFIPEKYKLNNYKDYIIIPLSCLVVGGGYHFLQYSIPSGLKIKYDIDYIYYTYYIGPERDEKRLIFSLLVFTLFFPLTELLFLLLHLNSISHLFDILEVEVVLILTTGFAQLRTKFINYRTWITISIILTGALFVIGLKCLL